MHINADEGQVRGDLEEVLVEMPPDGTFLLYFSGHGVKDPYGETFFAMAGTRRRLLESSALNFGFVSRVLDKSSCKRQVVVLDCCYAGGYGKTKADVIGETMNRLRGAGRVILTSSSEIQLSRVDGDESVFSRYFSEGLETGDADLDDDSEISVDDLFGYIVQRLHDDGHSQTPLKYAQETSGSLHLASVPEWRRNSRKAEPRPGSTGLAEHYLRRLSPAERRAVEEAFRGRSNEEIASAQQKTVGSVSSLLTKAYRKLNVRNRAEMVGLLLGR